MPNKHKILTLEQLVKFCEENHFYNFSSKDSGYSLSVQIPGSLSFDENSTKGLLFVKVKTCHTLLNRNGSYASEENMKKAMPSLKYRPLLAHIHQLDSGEYDFHAHDIEIVEDDNGEEILQYTEKQIGEFTADDPYLEYDKDMDKTYVIATAVIPEDYTMAADIIRRKNGTKVSCELCINSMSYNAKEKYLELEDFYFTGVTCLGCEKDGRGIGEGMLGSRLDIQDFSEANNSVFNCREAYQVDQDLINVLEKLNKTLSNFNDVNVNGKEDNQVNKFEELLNKYGKSAEDITFDYEGLSDDELETAFSEAFETSVNNTDNNSVNPENKEPEVFVKSFELSHDDIRYALYQLLSSYEDTDNEWYFINAVYDTYFTYENWSGDKKIFGQSYTKDGDNVTFDGERYNLHRELLTDSEYAELQTMRSNYSSIVADLEAYKKKDADEAKDLLFVSDDYKAIYGTKEFKELNENHTDFTLDDLKNKLDSILLSYAKSGNLNFSYENNDVAQKEPQKSFSRVNLPSKTKKKNKYGSLFSK